MDESEIRLRIIRAVNFCMMNSELITKVAIENTTTWGEIYYKLITENKLNDLLKDNKK